MGRLIVYCDGCGDRIVEEDLDKGRALQEAGRYYCCGCRPPTPARPAPVPKTATVRTAALPKASTSRHVVLSPPARSNAPIIAAGAAGVVAVIALLFVAVGGGGKTRAPRGENTPDAPAPDPLVAQRKLAESVRQWAKDHATDHAGIREKCEEALRTLDPSLRPPIEELQSKAKAALRSAQVARGVDDYLARARETAKSDPDCLMSSTVRGLLDEARKASGAASALLDRVTAAEREYDRAWQDAAGKAWKRVTDAADECLEKRNDPIAAARALDDFPIQFRLDEWARRWAERKAHYESRIGRDTPKPPEPGPEPAKSALWEDYQRAQRLFENNRDYAEGAKVMEDVLRRAGDLEEVRRSDVTEQQLQQILQLGHYNVACYYALHKKDARTACEHLEVCLKVGYNDWDHIDQDKDFDPIRASDPFKELSKKYRSRRILGVVCDAVRVTGLPEERGGLLVKRLTQGSVAEKGGLKVGDCILEIDKKQLPLADTQEKFRDIIAATKDDVDVPVVVVRDNRMVTLTVRWPKPKK